jgi:hypothetical protein
LSLRKNDELGEDNPCSSNFEKVNKEEKTYFKIKSKGTDDFVNFKKKITSLHVLPKSKKILTDFEGPKIHSFHAQGQGLGNRVRKLKQYNNHSNGTELHAAILQTKKIKGLKG